MAGTASARRPRSPGWRLPPRPATSPSSTWCGPPSTLLIGQGLVKPYAESDSSLRVEVVPAAPRGRRGPDVARAVPALRPRLVRLQPADACGAGGALALQQRRSGGPAPAGDLRARAGYDWRTVRPFRSKEEAGHEEPWFTFLAGEHPGLSGADPRGRPGAGPAPARARPGVPGHRHRRGRHPCLAAVQPRRDRGAGAAHLGRAAGALQRRAAAGASPLLRRRAAASRAAGRCGRAVSRPSSRTRPSSTWSTSTPSRTAR